jgi:hypothetical protein
MTLSQNHHSEEVMSYWKNILVLGLTAVMLAACSGDDADDLCEAPASTTGEPDITASPTFSAGPYTDASTITVTVPVDADTQTVVVDFADLVTNTKLGNASHFDLGASGTAQPVNVDVVLTGAATGTTYYPIIMLCSGGPATCTSAIGYIDDSTDLISANNYVRATASYDSTLGTYNIGSGISNSCVAVSSIVTS